MLLKYQISFNNGIYVYESEIAIFVWCFYAKKYLLLYIWMYLYVRFYLHDIIL